MIKSFKIVNNIGESITLDIRKPEDTGFLVSSVTGITYPKADIAMSEIAMFDGATMTNRRVGSRNIVMSIIFYDSNKDKNTIEELRHKCYRYFPIKQQVTFYVYNDSGTYWIKGYIEANETNIFSKVEAAQISIVCPDPYFTKSTIDNNAYISNVVPNFQFPVSFEVELRNITGYSKYSGPWIVLAKGTNETLATNKKYFYGDIVITKALISRIGNNAGGGYTAEIKGAKTPDAMPLQALEDPNAIFERYDGSTVFTPTASDQFIKLEYLYADSNIVVNKIPYTDTVTTIDGVQSINRTFNGIEGISFNPFSYTDYTGGYFIKPGTAVQTLGTAGKYILGNIVVAGHTKTRTTNSAGGYTDTITFNTDSSGVNKMAFIDSTTATRYTGPVTATPAAANVTLATRGKYSSSNITVGAVTRWEKNTVDVGPDNYIVHIGG